VSTELKGQIFSALKRKLPTHEMKPASEGEKSFCSCGVLGSLVYSEDAGWIYPLNLNVKGDY
jgi:hypothetical protein